MSHLEKRSFERLYITKRIMNYGKILGVAATIFLIIFLDTSSLIRQEYHRLKNIQQPTNRQSDRQVQNNNLIKRGSPTFTNYNDNNRNQPSSQEAPTGIQDSWHENLRNKTKQLQQRLEDSFVKLSKMFTKLTSRFNKTTSSSPSTTIIPKEKESADITQCSQSYQDWKTKAHPIYKQKEFSKEISTIESLFCRAEHDQIEKCNVTGLVGVLGVHEEDVSHQWLYEKELPFVHQGGWWSPEDCLPVQSTLIVIPFRDREDQLPILLRHLHPMLKRQQLHYRIIIVEQTGKGKFNRAKLANIGFVEGLKMFPYQCFIIHDVDLVPENDHIDYSCSVSPRHLSAAVSTFKYMLPYAKIFGGVSSLLSKHFQQVNGFSNLFYGWGGEDDNLYERLTQNNFKIQRHSIQIARYKMLKHKHYKPPAKEQRKLNEKLGSSLKHNKVDGLNTLQYDLVGIEENLLYTRVKVDVREDKEKFIFK